MRSPGRPHGEIALALLKAAEQPGTVRDLACRAQVGFEAARFKAKDLVRAGHLVVLHASRPMVVARPQARAAGNELARVWGLPSAG